MASIYKRGNVWYLSYRVGGKRVRKSVGKSKKLATLAQKEVEVGIAKKKLGWEEVRDPTFLEFKEEYLRYRKGNVQPTTYVRYKENTQHFIDFLNSRGSPSLRLSQISFQVIEEYKQERGEVVKPSTVNIELKVLRALYNFDALTGSYRHFLKDRRNIDLGKISLALSSDFVMARSSLQQFPLNYTKSALYIIDKKLSVNKWEAKVNRIHSLSINAISVDT